MLGINGENMQGLCIPRPESICCHHVAKRKIGPIFFLKHIKISYQSPLAVDSFADQCLWSTLHMFYCSGSVTVYCCIQKNSLFFSTSLFTFYLH